MDTFTDNDIFKDLLEACGKRKVSVYILLDRASFPHFLKMCRNLEVDLEQEKLMRVRTISGNTYCTRSGVKIVGKVQEKFLLVDGIRVTTGSYSFTWTDGKLSSSNILILSGPVVTHFDMEFRILFAQSKPINPKLSSSCKKSGLVDQLVKRTKASRDSMKEGFFRMEFFYLRAFVGNMRRKQSWLCATREGKCESNIIMQVSPMLTERNVSAVIRPHWSIER
nr:protein FAM83D-like [Pelodiscus sinensis]|eukprot:XP_006117087.1 protein FAM83D-like [Pelodiscus sinensis]